MAPHPVVGVDALHLAGIGKLPHDPPDEVAIPEDAPPHEVHELPCLELALDHHLQPILRQPHVERAADVPHHLVGVGVERAVALYGYLAHAGPAVKYHETARVRLERVLLVPLVFCYVLYVAQHPGEHAAVLPDVQTLERLVLPSLLAHDGHAVPQQVGHDGIGHLDSPLPGVLVEEAPAALLHLKLVYCVYCH